MKMTKWISMMTVIVLLVSLFAVGSVGVSAEPSKIRADLAEMLETIGDDEPVPVDISLINPPKLDEVNFAALIAEKYGITLNRETVDDYLMCERIERTAIFQPFFEEFFEDYKDGIVEKLFVPSGSSFCLLEVYKSTIYEMANDDRVVAIAYNKSEVQQPEDIDTDVIGDAAEPPRTLSELLEMLETMDDDEPVPVSINLIDPPALNEVSIPALIAEKYGITSINADTIDDYYMYERIEKTAIFQPFFEGFYEDYKDGIVEKLFVPSHSNFCVLEVYKSTIYEMANDDRVTDIAYFDNAIQENDAIDDLPEVIGDATGDGNLDMKDVLLTRKHVASVPLDRQFLEEKADVNMDGSIDMQDILIMRLLIMNRSGQDV